MDTVRIGFFIGGATLVAGAVPDILVNAGSALIDREFYDALHWSTEYKPLIQVIIGTIFMIIGMGRVEEIFNSKTQENGDSNATDS